MTSGTKPRRPTSAPADGGLTAHDGRDDDRSDGSMLDVWHSMSDPRQASCLAWLAFLVTWVVTRLITHSGRTDGSAAILIAGHHVHHYIFGLVLLGIVAAIALVLKPRRGWEFLGIGYGVALALILDEYALLLNLADVYWKQQGRLSVDVVLTFIAVGGVYVTGLTWVHEAGRRARRRTLARARRVHKSRRRRTG